MQSTYQNIVTLLISSLFIVGLWYIDKEMKNMQANIKIVQNMLKMVLSNQNTMLHNNSNQIHEYIPYKSETFVNIDSKSENPPLPLEETSYEEIQKDECSSKNDIVEEEIQKMEELPSEKVIEETQETISNEEVYEIQPQTEPPKKKRQYKKKNAEITV